MKRLSVFLYTQILGKKIYDEFGDVIGELKDVYVTTDEGYPRVIGYKVKKGSIIDNYEFRMIRVSEEGGKIVINTKGSREILPRTYTYLLSEHLLDRKVVDIKSKKVVRVNDLRIAEIAGEFRVVGVEIGAVAKFRRVGIPSFGRALYKMLGKEYDDKMLLWDDIESIEMVSKSPNNPESYGKLSSLHPADLADILEDLDEDERKQIFESLNEDLAAETFEEIEDEYKGSLIKDLSEVKTAELLENIGNDEIADLLDELDGEEREKVLVNLEKDDAEEVSELLKYDDETAGSIMSKDFISFRNKITVSEVIEIIKEMQPDEDMLHYIYVTDEEDKLVGIVLLKDLLINSGEDSGNKKLEEIMKENVSTINSNTNISDVIEQAAKYDLLAVAVVENEKLIGIVQIHDLIDEFLFPLWKKKNKVI